MEYLKNRKNGIALSEILQLTSRGMLCRVCLRIVTKQSYIRIKNDAKFTPLVPHLTKEKLPMSLLLITGETNAQKDMTGVAGTKFEAAMPQLLKKGDNNDEVNI